MDDWGNKTSLEKYKYFMEGEEEPDPVERLRFFLSIALSGQDWLDVEQFLDDIKEETSINLDIVKWTLKK